MRACVRLLTLVVAVGAPCGALAQESGVTTGILVVPRLTGPIVMDGRVEEAAWEAVEPLPTVMQLPTFEGEPTERTEFRIAYDDDYIYASCRNFDSNPSGIRALSLKRDDSSLGNDYCILVLDTFYDRETTLLFGTQPTGIRLDELIPNDARGGVNFDWNTFWDAAAARDERGWYAEIRVPLTSLRFQEADGAVVMGVTMIRVIARKSEWHVSHPISPEWGLLSAVKASQARAMEFRGISGGNPLYVTPYATGGMDYSQELNDGETAYDRDTRRTSEVGLDVKYGLAQNLTLDVSVNTDFAQVEASDQRINLTRFSLFFPEKRPFFQERSGLFEYSLGGNERLFHSRRIGLAGGEPIRIYGGARLVGRVGEWDVGALSMQSEGAQEGASSENSSVLRLRRRVFNENSYVGGILTTRLGNKGTRNVVYGSDGIFRLYGQDFLTLNWSQSFAPSDGSSVEALDRAFVRMFWERRGIDGLTYGLDLSRSGAVFVPGLGFLFRRDYAKGVGTLRHGWRFGPRSWFLRHELSVDATAFRRGSDGRLETVEVAPQWTIESKRGYRLTTTLTTVVEDLERSFTLSDDAQVLVGRYTFTTGRVGFQQSQGDQLRTGAMVEYGEFYDGRRASANLTTTWNPSMHLALVGTYRIEDVRFDQRDQHFRAHVVRLRTEARLDTRLSTEAFVQYSSAANSVSVNFRVRYNPGEGNDLYLVWNEGLVTDRLSFDPVRPLSDRRSLAVKYSRTFTLGF